MANLSNATTVRREADTAENLPSEFGHPLDRHPELRLRAERCLELMRQRLGSCACRDRSPRRSKRHHSGRDGRPRSVGVVNRYRNDVAAAVEMIHATTSAAVRLELAGKVCGLVMLHDSVMTVTNNDGVHVHFGWRSNPLGEWGLALWQDGHEPPERGRTPSRQPTSSTKSFNALNSTTRRPPSV